MPNPYASLDPREPDDPILKVGCGRDAETVERDGNIVGIVSIAMLLTLMGFCVWACLEWARHGRHS